MAQTVSVNFKLDAEVKKLWKKSVKKWAYLWAQHLLFLQKKVCREHRISFEISEDPFYSEKNIARLKNQ